MIAEATTRTVNAGGDLQAAINAAAPGDTILLQAGATFSGPFLLPAKSGQSFITIRSSAPDASLPGPGQRMAPAFAPFLPKILATTGPAISFGAGATYWRLLFLEFSPSSSTSSANLVEFGNASSSQNTLASVPAHLILDRSYLHGNPSYGQRRGLALNSADAEVTNSYFADFKGVSQDTQAIAGWNGPGPYLIENNYLEAAGENVIFGGGDPAIPYLVPSNITIRRNLLSRPLAWRTEAWTVKNVIELKNASNVVIEGNVIENHWSSAQQGEAIVLTPRNQDHTAPWSVVKNVVIQNNIVRHVSSGFNILGYDDGAPSQQTENIVIRNNLFYDVSTAYGTTANPAPARLAIIGAAPRNVTIDHNTVDSNGSSTLSLYGGTAPAGTAINGFVLTNNLLRDNLYGLWGDYVGKGVIALQTYAPNAVVQRNTFAGGAAKDYPTGNDFPTLAKWLADFVSTGAANYALLSTSLSINAGTDGKNMGVDFAELNAALAGTAPVPPTPAPAPTPGPLPSPWANRDVGTTGLAGSASYSSGTFTVKGAGADIWGAADAFQYVYQPLNGDGQIVARATAVQNTQTYAKAGIMLRGGVTASDADVILDLRPDGSIEFMSRSSAGGGTSYIAGSVQASPVWLKLVRAGTRVTGFVSANGSTWNQVGSTTVSMPGSAFVGLAVTSHDTSVLNTATFDTVTVASAASTPPVPGPTTPTDIVIYASDVTSLHGGWSKANDPTAAGGVKMGTSDNGLTQLNAPLPAPSDYVDVTFNANAGTAYTIWLRMQALNKSKYNDSVWIQFSDALVNGAGAYPIGSGTGLLVNLATDATGSSLSGWGWQSGAYWLGQAKTVTFASTGSHTLRIQIREDGVQIDQIVLSSGVYLNSSPGSATNDTTIVKR